MRKKQRDPKYIRGEGRPRKYTLDSLAEALEQIQEHGMKQAKASLLYNIPAATLNDYVLGKSKLGRMKGPGQLFCHDKEQCMADHMKKLHRLGYEYSFGETAKLAQDFAIHLGELKSTDPPVSRGYVKRFRLRYPELVKYRAEARAISKAQCSSSKAVELYFDEYELLAAKHGVLNRADCIINVDEVRIVSTSCKKHCRISLDKSMLRRFDHPNRIFVTAVVAATALGEVLRPLLIHVGNKDLRKSVSYGRSVADIASSCKGLSSSELILQFLQTTVTSYMEHNSLPHLIVLVHGHKSYVNLSVTEWAKLNNISIVILPAHASSLTHPLDSSIFRTVKEQVGLVLKQFTLLHPGLAMSRSKLNEIIIKVIYLLSNEAITDAFQQTGACPISRDILAKTGLLSGYTTGIVKEELASTGATREDDFAAVTGLHGVGLQDVDMMPAFVQMCKEVCRQTGSSEVELQSEYSSEATELVETQASAQTSRKVEPVKKGRTKRNGWEKVTPSMQRLLDEHKRVKASLKCKKWVRGPSSAAASDQCRYTEECLKKAVEQVRKNGMSLAKAERIYGVPRQTLSDYKLGKSSLSYTGGARLLRGENERCMAQHLKRMIQLGYRVSFHDISALATDFAIHLGYLKPAHPRLSKGYHRGFRLRYPEFKTHQALPTSEAIAKYFAQFESLVEKHAIQHRADCVMNIDEVEFHISGTPNVRIVTKGNRLNAIGTPRKHNVTAIVGATASGEVLQPLLTDTKSSIPSENPPGARVATADSGSANSSLFMQYLQTTVLAHIEQNSLSHLIVLAPGHKIYTSLSVMEWAKVNKISLVILPAHTSLLTHPLACDLFRSVRQRVNHHVEQFVSSHAGQEMSSSEVRKVIVEAFQCLDMDSVRNAFCQTGAFPLSRVNVLGEVSDMLVGQEKYVTEYAGQSDAESMTVSPDTCQKMCLSGPSEGGDKGLDLMQEGAESLQADVDMISSPYKAEANRKHGAPCSMLEQRVFQHPTTPGEGGTAVRKREIEDTEVPEEQSMPYSGNESSDCDDDDVCCICNKSQPKAFLNSETDADFLQWAQCSRCQHWVHLKFCSEQVQVAEEEDFYCIHCVPGEDKACG